MALIRFQSDVEPDPVSDARGSAGVATAWPADGKYAWVATLMIWATLLTLIREGA